MHRLFFICTAVLSLAADGRTAQDEIPVDGNRLVQVSLLANREAIRPGEKFILGIELEMEPRWHVYWVNPGDSGLATKAVIKAPAGFEVGNVIFPGPTRHEMEGDIVTYVYFDRVMLLAEVKAPGTLDPKGQSKFEVDCNWLVCDEICFPGEGHAELVLPGSGADAPRVANDAKFSAARAAIPRVWSELKGAELAWSGSKAEPKLRVTVPSAAGAVTGLEFFPLKSATMNLTGRVLNTDGATRRMDLSFAFTPKSPDTGGERPEARGLIMVRTGDSTAYYALSSRFEDPDARAGASR